MKQTAEQKAKELVERFWHEISGVPAHVGVELNSDDAYVKLAKKCAIACADEILVPLEEVFHRYGIGFAGTATIRHDIKKWMYYQFWKEVKEKIEQL